MHFKYGLDDRPAWGELLLFGLQWLAISIPSIIIIGKVVAVLQGGSADPIVYLQKLFLVIGLVLLVQIFWGHQLPLVVGPATVLLIGIISSLERGSAVINASIIIGGGILALLAVSGLFKRLIKLFTPRVITVILMLIAFTLAPTILNLMVGTAPVSGSANFSFAILLTLAIFIANGLLKGIWKSTLAIWSMLVGSLVYYWFFPLYTAPQNLAGLALPGNLLPALALPDLGVLVAFLICFLALAINDLGSIQSVGTLLKAGQMEKRITKGVTVTGAGNVLAGFFGVIGPVNFSMSPGVIAATGCASRYALVPAAIGLLFLAFSPLTIGFISSVPSPVIGAIMVYIMTAQIAAALLLVLESRAASAFDDGLIIGLPLMLGTIVAFLPPDITAQFPAGLRPIITNGFVVGVLAVLILEHLVYRTRPQNT
ncbi:MAG: uracil-xanthine permease family protein [Syntrophothermaceae bacterium]